MPGQIIQRDIFFFEKLIGRAGGSPKIAHNLKIEKHLPYNGYYFFTFYCKTNLLLSCFLFLLDSQPKSSVASFIPDPNRVMEKVSSNPSRRVRIIGKVRAFTNQESESLSHDSKSWITIHKPQEAASSETKVKISFSNQSSRYQFIECCLNVFALIILPFG